MNIFTKNFHCWRLAIPWYVTRIPADFNLIERRYENSYQSPPTGYVISIILFGHRICYYYI